MITIESMVELCDDKVIKEKKKGAKRAVNGSAVPVIEDFQEDEMKEVCRYLSVCALSFFISRWDDISFFSVDRK